MVDAAEEEDAQEIVSKPSSSIIALAHSVLVTYCIEKNIIFVAQGGAHGWATTLDQKERFCHQSKGFNQVKVGDAGDMSRSVGVYLSQRLLTLPKYEKGVQVSKSIAGGLLCQLNSLPT